MDKFNLRLLYIIIVFFVVYIFNSIYYLLERNDSIIERDTDINHQNSDMSLPTYNKENILNCSLSSEDCNEYVEQSNTIKPIQLSILSFGHHHKRMSKKKKKVLYSIAFTCVIIVIAFLLFKYIKSVYNLFTQTISGTSKFDSVEEHNCYTKMSEYSINI